MENNDEPRLWQPKTRNAVLGSFPVSGKECGALPRRRYALAKRMSDGRETGIGDEEEDVRGSWNSPLRLAPPARPSDSPRRNLFDSDSNRIFVALRASIIGMKHILWTRSLSPGCLLGM